MTEHRPGAGEGATETHRETARHSATGRRGGPDVARAAAAWNASKSTAPRRLRPGLTPDVGQPCENRKARLAICPGFHARQVDQSAWDNQLILRRPLLFNLY
jgi:hypothetical protein